MFYIVHWLYPFVHGLGLGVLAMLIHECGHVAAALALGVRLKNVGFKWKRGLYTVREKGTTHQNLVIALAGPGVNLLLVATIAWTPPFALANFCCCLANVLPIEGSDSYRIAACLRRIRSHEVTN